MSRDKIILVALAALGATGFCFGAYYDPGSVYQDPASRYQDPATRYQAPSPMYQDPFSKTYVFGIMWEYALAAPRSPTEEEMERYANFVRLAIATVTQPSQDPSPCLYWPPRGRTLVSYFPQFGDRMSLMVASDPR